MPPVQSIEPPDTEEDATDETEQNDAQPVYNAPVVAPPIQQVTPSVVAPPGGMPVAPPRYNQQAQLDDIQYRKMMGQINQVGPTAEVEQAVEAATKFQAQRGYQRDLANGMASHEALAKWAPMLFSGKGGNASGVASIIRATAPGQTQYRNIAGVLYSISPDGTLKALTQPKPIVPRANQFDLQEHASILGQIKELQKVIDADPEAPEANDARNKLRYLRQQAEDVRKRSGAPVAAPAPAATKGGRIRVRRPDGKIGSIPAEQLDAAVAAGYSRLP